MNVWWIITGVFFFLGFRSDDGGLYFFFAVQMLGLGVVRWLYRLDRSSGSSDEPSEEKAA